MTDPCVFVPAHEPWTCKTHPGGYRTSLAETVCRVRRKRVDWAAIERLVDAAIRRGEITASRGAEILGISLRTWRDRAVEIRDANAERSTPMTEPLSAEDIVRRASMMGLCSQTHHEHLMADAKKVRLATLDATPPPPDGLREALRAVLRDADQDPTDEYLSEAERIFRAALARLTPEANLVEKSTGSDQA